MTSGPAVAIISKLPRRGRSKTRLARTLGADAALALHRAFLEDELRQLHAPDRWQLYLIHDPPESDEERGALTALLGDRARSVSPGQEGLAAELREAFRRLLAHHDRLVIVSGDVPQISADLVAGALAQLDEADLVLGAGPDGGYYLIGLKAPHDLFTPIRMSTPAVEGATLALARRLGLRARSVSRLVDLDEAQDLLALEGLPASVAATTRAEVARLERSEHALALPSELQIEVTSRCNLRCSACLRTHERLAPDRDLTLQDYQSIVAELPNLRRIAFMLNGEPLLCRDLFAMIEAAKAAGVWTIVNSNGTLLDPRRRRRILSSGLDELRISLDGVRPETLQRMAGADTLDRVVGGLRALVAERGAASQRLCRISLWMIASRWNIEELPALVRLAAELGVEEVYLQRLVLTGRGVAQRAHSLHGQIDSRVERIVAEAQGIATEGGVALRASGRKPILESLTPSQTPNPWRACWRPWRTAVVTASRKVLPCCIASFTEGYDSLELGDLSDRSWAQVWNGERYRALRGGLLRAEPLPCCQRCDREWSL